MRRRRFVLGAVLALGLPLLGLVKSCGFAARIDVIQSFYDRSEFITFQRCGTGESVVDIAYALLNGEGKLMTADDPLFGGRGADAIAVETPDPFQVSGESATVSATVSGNAYVAITPTGMRPAVAILMDNSRSLAGFDESTGTRIPLTDPNDDRIAGAQNFVSTGLLPAAGLATVIAFHGDGSGGVDAKLRRIPAEQPSSSWFTSNTSLLSDKLAELRNEEDGKTPLYDAIDLGARALRTLSAPYRPMMLLFSDGPDNSSNPVTFEGAMSALTGTPQVPLFAIGLGSLLGEGESRLRDLTCATDPKGLYLKAPLARDLQKRFEQARVLITGYWRATLNLTLPAGLPSGTHSVTGKMFADPRAQPKQCDATQSPPCPRGMDCDTARNRCFMNVSFTITVP
jgi:hypothetical protein